MKDWQKHFPKLQAVKKVAVVPPKEHDEKEDEEEIEDEEELAPSVE